MAQNIPKIMRPNDLALPAPKGIIRLPRWLLHELPGSYRATKVDTGPSRDPEMLSRLLEGAPRGAGTVRVRLFLWSLGILQANEAYQPSSEGKKIKLSREVEEILCRASGIAEPLPVPYSESNDSWKVDKAQKRRRLYRNLLSLQSDNLLRLEDSSGKSISSAANLPKDRFLVLPKVARSASRAEGLGVNSWWVDLPSELWLNGWITTLCGPGNLVLIALLDQLRIAHLEMIDRADQFELLNSLTRDESANGDLLRSLLLDFPIAMSPGEIESGVDALPSLIESRMKYFIDLGKRSKAILRLVGCHFDLLSRVEPQDLFDRSNKSQLIDICGRNQLLDLLAEQIQAPQSDREGLSGFLDESERRWLLNLLSRDRIFESFKLGLRSFQEKQDPVLTDLYCFYLELKLQSLYFAWSTKDVRTARPVLLPGDWLLPGKIRKNRYQLKVDTWRNGLFELERHKLISSVPFRKTGAAYEIAYRLNRSVLLERS